MVTLVMVLRKLIRVTLLSIFAVAPDKPISMHVIASADPHAIRSPNVQNLTAVVCKQSVPICMKLGVMNYWSKMKKTIMALTEI